MSNNLKDAALKAVQKKSMNVEKTTHSNSQHSKLYKDYFDLKSGEPISLDAISKRVKRRFADIDRNSALAMMDLWFIHNQWTTFYSREDSFSRYVRLELEISRTHAYAILNSVELLNQYFIHKGGHTEADISDFINNITTSIDDIGVKKLSILSGFKSDDEKFEYLDRMLQGEQITAEVLLQKPVNLEKPKSQNSTVKMDGNDLKVGNTLVLTFNSENDVIRRAVFKAVEKWYLKDLEPKKVK